MNSGLGGWDKGQDWDWDKNSQLCANKHDLHFETQYQIALWYLNCPVRCFSRTYHMIQCCFVSVMPCFPMSISHEISGSLVSCMSVRDLTLDVIPRKLNLFIGKSPHSKIDSCLLTVREDDSYLTSGDIDKAKQAMSS